jgi:hypothetical protein
MTIDLTGAKTSKEIYAQDSKILLSELSNASGEYVFPVCEMVFKNDGVRFICKEQELTNDCTEAIVNDMLQFANWINAELNLLNVKMSHFYYARITATVFDTTQPPSIRVILCGVFE